MYSDGSVTGGSKVSGGGAERVEAEVITSNVGDVKPGFGCGWVIQHAELQRRKRRR